MINEEQIELLVERLIDRVEKANTYFLKGIGSSIKKIGKLSPSKAHELVQILKYGGNYDDIIKEIAKYTNMDVKEIDNIFNNYAKKDLDFYKKFYKYRNIPFTPFDQNTALKQQTTALSRVVQNEMYNYFRTNVLGYTITDEKGNMIFKGLKEVYNEALDTALLNVSQGKETFDSAMSKIMKDIGQSGLKTLNYESGRAIRLDSAVRMHLKSRLRELHNENQKIIGEEIDADGVEISVHLNPAPDHELAQGRQFSNQEYLKLNSGLVAKDYKGKEITLDHDNKNGYRPISEMNCYHYIFSIVLGVSEPEYNDKQLQDIIDSNRQGFDLDGKHYTNYEGTQIQRRLETEIRKQKDTQILAKASDNKELIGETQTKITQLTKKYKELSDVSGLPTKADRLRVSGYKRAKVINNQSKIEFNTLTDSDFVKMKNNSKQLINKLNSQEIKSLNYYTMTEYKDINTVLATPNIKNDDLLMYNNVTDVQKDISNIDSALKKSTIDDNVLVYKGTASKYFEDIEDGNEFELPIYLSTTGKESIARDKFMRNIGYKEESALLEIRVPKNTNGIYMSDLFNENGLNEYEILLNRNLKYKKIKSELIDSSGYDENGIFVHKSKYKKITLEVIK